MNVITLQRKKGSLRSSLTEAFGKKNVPATLLKERLWRRCFPENFASFLKNPFLTEHLL